MFEVRDAPQRPLLRARSQRQQEASFAVIKTLLNFAQHAFSRGEQRIERTGSAVMPWKLRW